MRNVNLKKQDTLFAEWICQELGVEDCVVTIDGKTLRGSKCYGETALEVVTVAGQELKGVLAQSQVQSGD